MCDYMIHLYPKQKKSGDVEESEMLTRLREDSILQCVRATTENRIIPHTKWIEYMKDFGANAKTKHVLIMPAVSLLPNCVQAKAGEKELKGKLGNHLFHNLNHITAGSRDLR